MSGDRTQITDPTVLRSLIGTPSPLVTGKDRRRLEVVHRAWLKASPFCVIATADATGRCTASPKGDPRPVTYVVDEVTLAIADRPGNRRVDGFMNLLANPHVGLLFMIPGRGDTMRIDGRGTLLTDAPYFPELAVRGKVPELVLEVAIERIIFHCSKAFVRSDLWSPESWRPDAAPSQRQITQALRRDGDEEIPLPDYADRLY